MATPPRARGALCPPGETGNKQITVWRDGENDDGRAGCALGKDPDQEMESGMSGLFLF